MTTLGELGHGVVLLRESDEALIVTSSRLQLPLRAREGRVPGTAVTVAEELYEAREAVPCDEGWRWRLVPWPEGETARSSFRLDADSIDRMAERAGEERAWEDSGRTMRLLLPLLGFAPGSWQERWEREHAYPAATAVTVSCLLEGFLGAVGIIQLATLRIDGWWLPTWLRWLVIAGPFLVAEALFRLTFLLAMRDPVGSVLGLPAKLFHRPPTPGPTPVDRRPRVVAHDEAAGHLELLSPVVRSDWREGGVLLFREHPYRLLRASVGGGEARYTFVRAEDEAPPTMRLAAAPVREAPLAKPKEGFLAGGGKILLLSFAPGDLQEDWCELTDVSPLLLTTFSSVIEAFGGAVNLLSDHGSSPWWLLDLFFVLEGLGRLVVSRLKGGPVGSVIGLPFLPLYRRWVREKAMEVLGEETPPAPSQRP